MAIILKPSGERIEVFPENGKTFKFPEIQKHVGGYYQVLRGNDGHFICMDEDGKSKALEVNEEATALLRGIIFCDDFVVGDVLLCNDTEAGVGVDDE